MNILQLVFKQMRQRALSTWLTILSVLLGVGLAVAILILYREGGDLFVQRNYGYEVIVGPAKGSPLQLVLNTVYQIDISPGMVPYQVYEDLVRDRQDVKIAIPYAVGDSYKGLRIVGTSPRLFGVDEDGTALPPERVMEYQQDKRYQLAQGKVFHPARFEAIIGSDVPQRTGLNVGGAFKATHGLPRPNETPDEHDQIWTVVGRLKQTHTAADRLIFIPLNSFYAIAEHENALEQQAQLRRGQPATRPPEEAKHFALNPDGTIDLKLPKEDWQLSAVLIKARGAIGAATLLYRFKVIDLRASAVNPADEMRKFFDTFLKNTTVILLLISLLVVIVAAIGILVAIYNSVSARLREIAILRALGATRNRILTLICLEAGLIGLIGGLGGVIIGHLAAAAGSIYLQRILGQTIQWFTIGREEILGLAAVVAISVIAGLVPALKAYRTPVATNLLSG